MRRRRRRALGILFLMFKHTSTHTRRARDVPFLPRCRSACMIRNQICRLHRARSAIRHCSVVASCSARYYRAAREESIRSPEAPRDNIGMDSQYAKNGDLQDLYWMFRSTLCLSRINIISMTRKKNCYILHKASGPVKTFV